MIEKLSPRQVGDHLRAAVRLALSADPVGALGFASVALLTGLLPVVAAWLTKLVLDRLAGSGSWSAVLPTVLGLFAAAVLMGVSPSVGQYLSERLNRRVAVVAMDRLYRAVGRSSGLSRIEDPTFRDRLMLAQQAGRGGPGRLVEHAFGIASATLTLAGFLGTLLVLNSWVALVAFTAAVPNLVAQLRLARARAAVAWRITPLQRREIHYAELLVSVAAGKELRLLGLGELFRGRMVGEMLAANVAQDRQQLRETRTEGVLALLSAGIAGGCLLWAVWLATHGRFSVGDVSVFILALAGLQANLRSIIMTLGAAQAALLLFHQYREVERAEPDLPVPASSRPTTVLRDGIEVDDVWFRYGPDKPWVLRGVTMTIRRGQAVALVGLNGAGKSSLIKLLCRFYDPTRGVIRWDGTDLREMDPTCLRERIGAVFQDYMEYDLSAAENVGVGDRHALDDRARIVAAAQRAGADSVITQLPHGYHTLLSRIFADAADAADPETGVLLSGGQWQRIALARAFMRDGRDLMILDEPSSGLDAQAESEIHERLRQHRADATSVLVSHRLAAVREADTIVVLTEGRVSEAGTHAGLLAANGDYARLFRLQARGYESTGPTAVTAHP